MVMVVGTRRCSATGATHCAALSAAARCRRVRDGWDVRLGRPVAIKSWLRPDVPWGLVAAIEPAMAQDPEKRFDLAGAMRGVLIG